MFLSVIEVFFYISVEVMHYQNSLTTYYFNIFLLSPLCSCTSTKWTSYTWLSKLCNEESIHSSTKSYISAYHIWAFCGHRQRRWKNTVSFIQNIPQKVILYIGSYRQLFTMALTWNSKYRFTSSRLWRGGLSDDINIYTK